MAVKVIRSSGWRWSWGIMVLALAVLVLLSLASFRPDDIPENKMPANSPALNFIGPVGAWTAYLLFMGLGVGAYVFAVALLGLGLFMVFQHEGRVWPKAIWLLVITLMLSMLLEIGSGPWTGLVARLNIGSAGGGFGRALTYGWLIYWLGSLGTVILALALLCVGLFFVFDWHPVLLARQGASGGAFLLEKWQAWRAARHEDQQRVEQEEREVAKRRRRLEEAVKDSAPAGDQPALPLREEPPAKARARPVAEPEESAAVELPPAEPAAAEAADDGAAPGDEAPVAPKRKLLPRKPKAEPPPPQAPAPLAPPGHYDLPPLTILDPVPP